MSKLLLVSSSRVHGTGILEHCRDAIAKHFAGTQRVLFIPYALQDHDGYESTIAAAFAAMEIKIESIHHAADPVDAVRQAKGIFVGGGNSFRLLKTLYDLNLLDPIKTAVQGSDYASRGSDYASRGSDYASRAVGPTGQGIPYMGSSAGTNMACPTIRTSNDMPIVEPTSFNALGLIPFQINPHFIDADPTSTHKGETREQRLAEFHEENSTPVAGLREGSWLEVSGTKITLCGATGMKLFRPGQAPEEHSAGDVSFLAFRET